ncbi:MAG: hypothetical protein K8I60_20425, partial [Anaerolineae bacterium]|nr:hypothetical protein [Anaerolineae bacterium]
MRRLGSAFTTALVMVFGVLMILGLVVGDGLGTLSTFVQAFKIRELSDFALQMVVITIAVAVLVGIINLLVVHFNRII